MRPDEHKKKKNTLYKKKHGITTNEKEKHTQKQYPQTKENEQQHQTKEGGLRPLSSTSVNEKRANAKETNQCKDKIIPLKPYTTDPSRPPEADDLEKYQCRKLTSNWERYVDDTQDNASTSEMGANFQDLISNSASALVDFTFEDINESSSTGIQLPFLKVNTDSLLTAVVCVPLHERLCISEEWFEEEQLHEFRNQAAFNATMNTTTICTAESETSHKSEEIISNSKDVSLHHPVKDTDDLLDTLFVTNDTADTQLDEIITVCTSTTDHKADVGVTVEKDKPRTNMAGDPSQLCLPSGQADMLDLLDSLLGNDQQIQPSQEFTKTEKAGVGDEIQSWLDDLLFS